MEKDRLKCVKSNELVLIVGSQNQKKNSCNQSEDIAERSSHVLRHTSRSSCRRRVRLSSRTSAISLSTWRRAGRWRAGRCGRSCIHRSPALCAKAPLDRGSAIRTKHGFPPELEL